LAPSFGQGRTYGFTSPDGHKLEIFWDVERYAPTESERSSLACSVQKRPLRGVPVRRIDHLNLLAADVTSNKRFFEDVLSFRTRERIEPPDRNAQGAWTSASPV